MALLGNLLRIAVCDVAVFLLFAGFGRLEARYSQAFPAAGVPKDAGNNSITVPSGTPVEVRTREIINAENANSNRSYTAQLNQDIVDAEGHTVIPRGAEARLGVKSSGEGQLVVGLQSILVNGQPSGVSAQAINPERKTQAQAGANKPDTEYAGGGTVLGALLGAIAGGGDGAAIGALTGAAAGAATQVLTSGSQIRVPAETLLNFRLDRPLILNLSSLNQNRPNQNPLN